MCCGVLSWQYKNAVPRKKVEPRPAEGLTIATLSETAPCITEQQIAVTDKPKKKRGRPTKSFESLSEKTIREIGQLARLGMNERLIAGAIGISVEKMGEWKEKHPEFKKMLDTERERFVQDNLAKLRNHAQTSPQSAMWLLERVRPEEFSSKAELRISGGVNNTTTMDISPSVCQLLADARMKTVNVEALPLPSSSSVEEVSG